MKPTLHLVTAEDGGDSLERLPAFRAVADSRILIGHVGDPRRVRRMLPRPDLVFDDSPTSVFRNHHTLDQWLRAEGVDLVHAWGGPAADLVSAVAGLRRQPCRWVAWELPADWKAPAMGTLPEVEFGFGPASAPLPIRGGWRKVRLPSAAPGAFPARAAARAELGLAPQAPVVAWGGPIAEAGDLLTSIWSVSILSKIHPDMTFLILGEGPLSVKLHHFLGTGTVRGCSRRVSERSSRPSALAASDVFLHTDSRPWVSGTLEDALAAGLPVAATDSEFNRVLLGSGGAGFCRPRDGRDHARVLHELLEDRPASRRMGAINAGRSASGPFLDPRIVMA